MILPLVKHLFIVATAIFIVSLCINYGSTSSYACIRPPREITNARSVSDVGLPALQTELKANTVINMYTEGNSMFPSILGGMVCRCEPFDQIEIGDVMVYQRDNTLINHRVHHILSYDDGSYGFIFKGDNNLFLDAGIVPLENVLCKIPKIYK
jgi:hypothetical protein